MGLSHEEEGKKKKETDKHKKWQTQRHFLSWSLALLICMFALLLCCFVYHSSTITLGMAF